MKDKLNWLFNVLAIIGGLAYTLAFFNIGNDIFDRFYIWFLSSLMIGVIGNLLLKMYEKKQNKDSTLLH